MNTVIKAFEQLCVTAGLKVAVSRVPDGAGWSGTPGQSTFVRYGSIHPLAGRTDGSTCTPDRDVSKRIQVTIVGPTPHATLAYSQQFIDALCGKRITTPTRVTLQPIYLDQDGELDRDDTVKPSVFMVPHIFGVDTTPINQP